MTQLIGLPPAISTVPARLTHKYFLMARAPQARIAAVGRVFHDIPERAPECRSVGRRLSMLSIEERALFTAPRVDRQHCPDQINFPPSLPRCSDPVWPLRRPIPLWAPFASRASACPQFARFPPQREISPSDRPRDRQSTVFRTRPRRSSSASARARRETQRGDGGRGAVVCRGGHTGTHSPTSSAAAAAGRRKGSAILSDGHTDGGCSPIP